jgi:hypothetical protein
MSVDGLEDHIRPHSRRRRICSSCSVETVDSEGQDTVTCLECHFQEPELKMFLGHAADAYHRSSLNMVYDPAVVRSSLL